MVACVEVCMLGWCVGVVCGVKVVCLMVCGVCEVCVRCVCGAKWCV